MLVTCRIVRNKIFTKAKLKFCDKIINLFIAAQFTFNRDKNVDLAHYMEEGIPEEDEEDSDTDQHSLNISAGTPRLQLNETDQGA
jgi:hypothetical protein